MELTKDQQNAIGAFTGFMLSEDKEMVISGPAGVGKSTVLRHLVQARPHDEMMKAMGVKPISDWRFTATTNKAAEVLNAGMHLEASTVHSALGLSVRNNFETGETFVTRKANSDVLMNSILVIDECSMVDTHLRRLINESTYKCKIVYVGDHCQLAPIKEPISPVFAQNEPVMINEIVRSQHTPAITALSNQLREMVETGVFTPIQEVPGVIDYLNEAEAEQQIRLHFTEEHENVRILCYTNHKVNAFNSYIRGLRNLPPEFTVGEWVVSNSAAYTVGGGRVRIEQELQILEIGKRYDYTLDRNNSIAVQELVTDGGIVMIPQVYSDYWNYQKFFSKNKDWVPYFKLKEWICDLRPRSACTVYKAQGSTYETVFVNLSDIGTSTNPAQAARMLYVACTRPTHHIKFIGQLPGRFRGE